MRSCSSQWSIRVAQEIRDEINRPVCGKQRDAGVELRKHFLRADAHVDLIKPEPVNRVGRDDCERLDGVPVSRTKHVGERSREQCGCNQRTEWNFADSDGCECEKICEARGDFAVIAKRVRDHRCRNYKQKHKSDRRTFNEPNARDVVQRVRCEICERPASAQNGAARDAIVLFFLADNSGGKENRAQRIAESDFSAGSRRCIE